MERSGKKAYLPRHLWRLATAPVRTFPDFLIIGAQKCGTTFLYQLLTQHPNVKSAFHKEVHFFDLNFEKGTNWYRSNFPLQIRNNRAYITGESSPYYLFHPHAARRASAVVPEAKLIVLLRNPVDRAYSHFQHQVMRVKGAGHEVHSFEEAIEIEERMMPEEVRKMLQDEHYRSLDHRNYSYLSRGKYVDQLLAWARFFDRSQMLVLRSEDLFRDTTDTLTRLLDFLEIPPWVPKKMHSIPNKREYTDVSPVTRQRLADYFGPYNRMLYEYLEKDFGW